MPATRDNAYQARCPAVDTVERGLVNDLTCPIYDNDSLVEPTSGTITIYDPNNVAIVDAEVVGIANSVAIYSYSAPSDLGLAEGYRVVWELVIGGITYRFRNVAEVVRHRLYNPVTGVDVYRHAPALDPNGNDPIHRDTDLDDQLTEAFAIVESKIRNMGRRPHLIFDPSSIRLWVIHLTIALKLQSLSHRGGGDTYAQRAAEHLEMARAEEKSVQFVYAPDDAEEAPRQRTRNRYPGFFLR
jgi:RNA polymerase subunit RPABC4/transcription elongation factor Spt4